MKPKTKTATLSAQPRHSTVRARAPIPKTGARRNGNQDDAWKNRRDTTFIKLRSGDWGLRGYNLEDGDVVDVLMKDGNTKQETVGAVIWRDQEGSGLCLASVRKKTPTREPGADDGDELPHHMR